MTTLDPLKSVTALGNVDDTSLALPSRHKQLTGEQRVRQQVLTVRRTKSRQPSSSGSRSGSAPVSPTSPLDDSVFLDSAKSITSNGSLFYGNGYSKSHMFEKNINRQIANSAKVSAAKKYASAYNHERRYGPVDVPPVGQRNTSRSEPDLVSRRFVVQPTVPSQRMVSKNSNYLAQRSTSQYITGSALHPQPLHLANGSAQTKMNGQFIYTKTNVNRTQSRPSVIESTSKSKGHSGMNGNSGVADITMKEAVRFLSSKDEEYQYCGTSYIQHKTYTDDKAKEEVLNLKGIPELVALVCSSSARVSLTASAALRNLSFKSDSNKEEIHRCGGITKAAEQFKASNSVDLDKQLTGLLWNLSSSDNLRTDLVNSALPVLMERVFVPGSDNHTKSKERDSDVFYHTTGCLRNLSSAQVNSRYALRKQPHLIDSLVRYIQECVAAGKPNDLSLENCVGVLHNLTFNLETEAPSLFKRIATLVSNHTPKDNTSIMGCFSSPSKGPEVEPTFDFATMEEPMSSGAGWLIHSTTLSSYLSLLKTSQREETQEACCGAMRNLTAHEGTVSNFLSHTIVKKLNGMKILSPLLKSSKVNLQKNILTLISYLMRNPNLISAIGGQALPELLDLISQGPSGAHNSDDNLALACQTASYLITKEPEMSKNLLKDNLIKSLTALSKNQFMPKSKKAASVLLYIIWSDKDLQSFLKKQGMNKSTFVNDTTVGAYRLLSR